MDLPSSAEVSWHFLELRMRRFIPYLQFPSVLFVSTGLRLHLVEGEVPSTACISANERWTLGIILNFSLRLFE